MYCAERHLRTSGKGQCDVAVDLYTCCDQLCSDFSCRGASELKANSSEIAAWRKHEHVKFSGTLSLTWILAATVQDERRGTLSLCFATFLLVKVCRGQCDKLRDRSRCCDILPVQDERAPPSVLVAHGMAWLIMAPTGCLPRARPAASPGFGGRQGASAPVLAEGPSIKE